MTLTTKVTNCHPDYGPHDTYRAEVLRYAETCGVKAASASFNLAPSTVYSWRKRMIKRATTATDGDKS